MQKETTQPGKLPEEVEQDIFNLVEKYLTLDKHRLTPNEAVDAVTVYAEKWHETRQHLEDMEHKFNAAIYDLKRLVKESEKLKEELEETTTALEQKKVHSQQWCDKAMEAAGDRVAMQAENEKLKAALEEISKCRATVPGKEIIKIAAEALASGGKEGDNG